jgi:glycogen debranching enzyme
VYAAYRARASTLALDDGDHGTANAATKRADELRRRFNEDFWLEEHGTYALGLDGDKRPIDALASNIGHCLWTGIVRRGPGDARGRPLLSESCSRASESARWRRSMRAYNPVSYHNGSVWPHDNAIAASPGLASYGLTEDANRIIAGAAACGRGDGSGRLPELFAGFDTSELAVPRAVPDVVLAAGVGRRLAAAVQGLPEGLEVMPEARQPLSAYLESP